MNDALVRVIEGSKRIVFFGGAGVSTESGIPDFRSAKGLFNADSGLSASPEKIVSHSFFLAHPDQFFDYYRKHLVYEDARPGPAHLALARLEQQGKVAAIVTQNIDGLHQAAGSRRVLDLHGSILRNTCLDCGRAYGLEAIVSSKGIPHCSRCGGIIKPDVVLYQEPLDEQVWQSAAAEIGQADTLIVGGTSLSVYPAASLLHFFGGKNLVLINKDPTPYDSAATLAIREPIGQTLARCCADLPL